MFLFLAGLHMESVTQSAYITYITVDGRECVAVGVHVPVHI